jgi:Co/Zn/Cd efflux system component
MGVFEKLMIVVVAIVAGIMLWARYRIGHVSHATQGLAVAVGVMGVFVSWVCSKLFD